MFDIQNYHGFIMAILLFQAIPGAGTITILNATARGGVRGGMSAVCGTLSGDFIYMLAAVLGLAAVLKAYPGILATAQWIGAFYLCWMGLKLLCSSKPKQDGHQIPAQEGRSFYTHALGVSFTNPKVIMFFMAFFPQFLAPGSRPITLVILMMHVSVISLMYQTGLVFIGHTAARYLSRWKYAGWAANRLAGIAFIGFGAKLAINNR
jgi:threonine/homoserine/homoserine lactone efflux protein